MKKQSTGILILILSMIVLSIVFAQDEPRKKPIPTDTTKLGVRKYVNQTDSATSELQRNNAKLDSLLNTIKK